MSINNNGNDFSPITGGYSRPTKLKYWCQKVLPLVYDDSLSYYELLCKVVSYLNSVIDDLNKVENDIEGLGSQYTELHDYVEDTIGRMRVDLQDMMNVIDTMYGHLELMEQKVTDLDTAVGDVDDRVTVAEGQIVDILNRLTICEGDISNIYDGIRGINTELVNVNNKITQINEDLDDIEDSIVALGTQIGYVRSMIANAYDNTSTYDKGEYCIYNNALYVCNADISVAESWTAAHWTQVILGDVLKDDEDLLSSLELKTGEHDGQIASLNNHMTSAEGVTNAISALLIPANNGKVIGIVDGQLAAVEGGPSYQSWQGGSY